MRYRQLGSSGLRVSVLTMGTMTFGGSGSFANVDSTDVDTARQQIDQCLEAAGWRVRPLPRRVADRHANLCGRRLP